MNPFAFPGFDPSQMDPSKLDPKMLMELSRLIQQLPSEQLSKMQTLMHNAQAGFDVRKEMEEFERNLPPGFREKVMTIFGGAAGAASMSANNVGAASTIDVTSTSTPAAESEPLPANMKEARLTILRAVAEGRVSPDEAERLLFQE